MNPSGYTPNGARLAAGEAGTGHEADARAEGDRRGENLTRAERSVSGSVTVSAALGEAWVRDVADALRAQTRGIIGAWPGTLREARSRVLVGLPAARRSTFDPAELDALSRAVYEAARRCWDAIAEPDPEP